MENIAALFGIPPSRILYANIIRETRRKKRDTSEGIKFSVEVSHKHQTKTPTVKKRCSAMKNEELLSREILGPSVVMKK